MDIDTSGRAPIFIVGTGRCGTTIIYQVLSMHPDLAWISSWVNAARATPALVLANRLWGVPGADRFRTKRFVPKPVEAMVLFSRTVKDYFSERLDESVVAEGQARLVPLVRRICSYHGKPRFVGKIVGRPVKVSLLAQVFPDARFIHITRGLKPTVASLMQVDFYTGWGALHEWPWDEVPPAYLSYHEGVGRSEAVGVAITVKLNRDELDRQLAALAPDRWIEIPYAEFVSAPEESLTRIGDLAQLEMDDRLRRAAGGRVYGGADEKWKRYFSPEQIEQLEGFEALVA